MRRWLRPPQIRSTVDVLAFAERSVYFLAAVALVAVLTGAGVLASRRASRTRDG